MSYYNKLLAFGKIVFKSSVAYRFQFLSSIVISPLILLLYYFIWQSIYLNQEGTPILGYTFTDMITYYVLSMVVGHFIFNMVGNDLQEKITYGDLIQDMLKPMSVFAQFLSSTVAERAFAFFVEVVPVFVIAVMLFNLQPAVLPVFLLFGLAVVFAFLINFMIAFLMGLLAFWVSRIESIQWLMFFFVRFLSGEFIPLEFFGTVLFAVSKYLPFYYIRYGPIQVYLARWTFSETLVFLLIQVAWIVVLYILIRIIWRYALRRFGALGG
jgi:ABC-2 type transport system permease protein